MFKDFWKCLTLRISEVIWGCLRTHEDIWVYLVSRYPMLYAVRPGRSILVGLVPMGQFAKFWSVFYYFGTYSQLFTFKFKEFFKWALIYKINLASIFPPIVALLLCFPPNPLIYPPPWAYDFEGRKK